MFQVAVKIACIIFLWFYTTNLFFKYDNVKNKILTFYFSTLFVIIALDDFFQKRNLVYLIVLVISLGIVYAPLLYLSFKKKTHHFYIFNVYKSEQELSEFIKEKTTEYNLGEGSIEYLVNKPNQITYKNIGYKTLNKINQEINKFVENKTQRNYYLIYFGAVLALAITLMILK